MTQTESDAAEAPALNDIAIELGQALVRAGMPPESMAFASLLKLLVDDTRWYLEQLEDGDLSL